MIDMNVFFEIIGVLGFVTNVWANILLARKTEAGWIIRLGANVLWMVYGLAIVSLANILSSGVFAVINVYGWRRWRRERLAGPPSCEACLSRELADAQAVIAAMPSQIGIQLDDKLVRATLKDLFPREWPPAISIVGEIDNAVRIDAPREEVLKVGLSSDVVSTDSGERR